MRVTELPEPHASGHDRPASPREPPLGRLRQLYLTLRTEHTTPRKVGLGVGLGLFVGCSPFWGLHFPLCVLLATLFRTNRMLVYAACNLVNPLTAPFVIFAEVQVGNRLLSGGWLPLTVRELRAAGLAGLFADFLVGGLVVGAAAGVVLGLLAYAVARSGAQPADYQRVVDEAVRRYLAVSVRDAEASWARLVRDPVYRYLLSEPSFLEARRVLDLGCGRGLCAAIAAARRGAPPGRSYVGVDVSPRYVRVAREALGGLPHHTFVQADLRDYDPPPADFVLLLNVLRFLPAASQDALLRRVGRAIHPGARLWIREIDAGAGWRFYAAAVPDLLARLLPGRHRAIGWRRAGDLRNALVAAGFEVRDRTTLHGGSRGRVLLEAVRRPAAVPGPGPVP